MRLAVFTNEYPCNVATFFARDLRALLELEIEIDVFAFYELDPAMWQWTPAILPESVFPRSRVHHVPILRSLTQLRPWPLKEAGIFACEAVAATASALRFGVGPLMKSLYVLPKAWSWARYAPGQYDHVLAYWGKTWEQASA